MAKKKKYVQTIEEKIQQRRLQMLVHSYIYYELDDNIIPDSKWSQWAMELVDLQKKYPKESKKVQYYDVFKDFDGSSGFDLPYNDTKIIAIAHKLLSYVGH